MRQRRLIAFCTDHGGINPDHFLPALGPSPQTRSLYAASGEVPAHRVRFAPLTPTTRDGWTELSSLLRAPSGELSSGLVEQMNVLTGFDIAHYIGHNRGAFLGNYAANDQGEELHAFPLPTIDQLVARHPAFELNATPERSLNFGIGHGVGSDIRFSASVTRNGETVVPVRALDDVRLLWERIFERNDVVPDAPNRTPVIDRVYDHYRDLLSGAYGDAGRLSRNDRVRLEHHVDLIADLQRKISVAPVCEDSGAPDVPRNDIERLQTAVDLMAAGIRCGATNVAVLTTTGEALSEDTRYTQWHNEVAHDGGGAYDDRTPVFQEIGGEAQGRFFREVFVRMAAALDVQEDEDGTFLDRSLVYWGMESGEITHDGFALPIVTAGSADGFFETGRFIDFRNFDNDALARPDRPFRYPGVLYNRFLANVLQSMGVAPADYGSELARVQPEAVANGARGYGLPGYHQYDYWSGVVLRDRVWPWSRFETADELLPVWVRGA